MKTYFAFLATFVILAIGVGTLFGQDNSPPNETVVTTVPLIVELKEHIDYAIVDEALYEQIAQIEAKQDLALTELDEIKAHLGLGEDTRPDLNTIEEQELFGIMSVAKIYGARSKAALIWSWINDQGNTIQAKADLVAIPGVGEVTVDALWPLIKTTD